MCFAIKKGVLMEEAKIQREEAWEAGGWDSPPPSSQNIILQSTNLLPKQSI